MTRACHGVTYTVTSPRRLTAISGCAASRVRVRVWQMSASFGRRCPLAASAEQRLLDWREAPRDQARAHVSRTRGPSYRTALVGEEAEDRSASWGWSVVAENEQTAGRECQTSDRQTSDQRREPVERGRAAPALRDDDRSDGVAGVDCVRDVVVIGSAGGDHRFRRRARREAITTIVGSRCGCRALNVGAVRQVTAVGRPAGPSAAVLMPAQMRATNTPSNERNPEHVELLLFGPLGAAGQDTVVCSRRNEGNSGCKTAATTARRPCK